MEQETFEQVCKEYNELMKRTDDMYAEYRYWFNKVHNQTTNEDRSFYERRLKRLIKYIDDFLLDTVNGTVKYTFKKQEVYSLIWTIEENNETEECIIYISYSKDEVKQEVIKFLEENAPVVEYDELL